MSSILAKSQRLSQHLNMSSFFKWWFEELSFFIPAAIKKRFKGKTGDHHLLINEMNISAHHIKTGTETILLELSETNEPQDKKKQQAKSLIRQLQIPPSTNFVIDHRFVLETQFSLPKSADGPHLKDIVRNQLPQRTPFKPTEILFDYQKMS